MPDAVIKMILIYITNPNRKTAKKISEHLLKKKLIACANIFPIESIYWWDGKLENAKEWAAIVKTNASKYKAIEKEIRKLHPYKVPCIMKIKMSANKKYEKWMTGELK